MPERHGRGVPGDVAREILSPAAADQQQTACFEAFGSVDQRCFQCLTGELAALIQLSDEASGQPGGAIPVFDLKQRENDGIRLELWGGTDYGAYLHEGSSLRRGAYRPPEASKISPAT